MEEYRFLQKKKKLLCSWCCAVRINYYPLVPVFVIVTHNLLAWYKAKRLGLQKTWCYSTCRGGGYRQGVLAVGY